MNEFEAANKRWWEAVTDRHVETYGNLFVGVDKFLAGHSTVDDLQLGELGPLEGKSLLHLMCHFGLDTLSLARLGADATGIDISEKSIEHARRLSTRSGVDASFICTDLYDLPLHLEGRFDIVYTSQGVLNWLGDIERWARLVSSYLQDGGVFYIQEMHPVVASMEGFQGNRIEF